MTLFNDPNRIGFDGTPITGVTPPVTVVRTKDGRGAGLTGPQQGTVQHMFKLFCDAVRVSTFPDGYHTQHRKLPDGTFVRMTSMQGVKKVEVVTPDGSAIAYDILPNGMVAKDAMASEKYVLPGTRWVNPPAKNQPPNAGGQPWGVTYAPDYSVAYPSENPEKKERLIPGNTDWYDMRPGSKNRGLVLSWWRTSNSRYRDNARHPSTKEYAPHDCMGAGSWVVDFGQTDEARTVWCNGIPILKVPEDQYVRAACIGEKDASAGEDKVVVFRVITTVPIQSRWTDEPNGEYDTDDTIRCLEYEITPQQLKEFRAFIINPLVDKDGGPIEPTVEWTITGEERYYPLYANASGSKMCAFDAGASLFRKDATGTQLQSDNLIEIDLDSGAISTALDPEQNKGSNWFQSAAERLFTTPELTLPMWSQRTILWRGIMAADYYGDQLVFVLMEVDELRRFDQTYTNLTDGVVGGTLTAHLKVTLFHNVYGGCEVYNEQVNRDYSAQFLFPVAPDNGHWYGGTTPPSYYNSSLLGDLRTSSYMLALAVGRGNADGSNAGEYVYLYDMLEGEVREQRSKQYGRFAQGLWTSVPTLGYVTVNRTGTEYQNVLGSKYPVVPGVRAPQSLPSDFFFAGMYTASFDGSLVLRGYSFPKSTVDLDEYGFFPEGVYPEEEPKTEMLWMGTKDDKAVVQATKEVFLPDEEEPTKEGDKPALFSCMVLVGPVKIPQGRYSNPPLHYARYIEA